MRTLLTFTFLLALLQGVRSSPAAAEDDQPCGDAWWHENLQLEVQDCELWTDAVPVYAGYEGEAATQVVGELVSASGNWFVCQIEGASSGVPGTEYVNTWWAETMADNGEWGFVNQAYFAGGDNNEPDANLRHCSDAPGEEEHADEKAEEQRQRDEAEKQAVDYEWSDCIWGDAPREYIVATFTEKDGTSYTLTCGGVVHIKEGHGFNDRTIPCIARVLAEYDSREPSTTDRRYDVFRLQAEIAHSVGNYIDAKVVMERTNRFVITAYVETYALGDLPAYEGDPWAACSPVSDTA